MAFRGPKVWLWRWRRNPLKRPADTVEAWVLLGAWALTVLAGVVVGLVAAGSVEDDLARERVEWRPLVARLTEGAAGDAAGHSRSSTADRVWAEAGWSGPDGSAHTGQVRVAPGSEAGTPVTVWTDLRGRMVTEPVGPAQARMRSTMVGGLAGVGAAAVPFAVGRLLRGRMERRRIAQWDTDWARFTSLWGRPTG